MTLAVLYFTDFYQITIPLVVLAAALVGVIVVSFVSDC